MEILSGLGAVLDYFKSTQGNCVVLISILSGL